MKKYGTILCMAALSLIVVAACTDNNTIPDGPPDGKELDEEWYAGGVNGTVFNATSSAYSQSMPAVDASPALYKQFMRGEQIFEKSFVSTEGMGYSGLGPVYIRKSCIACHPSYGGRSKRVDKFDTSDSRNGYLLMIYDPA
ncbi:hypothetical protein EZS27_034115, partial [termite gut metagenome]